MCWLAEGGGRKEADGTLGSRTDVGTAVLAWRRRGATGKHHSKGTCSAKKWSVCKQK